MAPMIIVKLIGGLGNQLFQYALGRCLAYRCGAPLKLDLSFYEGQTLRSYRLGHFSIAASIASPEEVMALTGIGHGGFLSLLDRAIRRLLPYHRRTLIRERKHRFDPDVLKVCAPAYLLGYWQSERYFKDIEGQLRQEFRPRHTPDPVNQAMADRIRAVEAVSVHVRRGDYVTNPTIHHVHGACSLEYYRAAVGKVAEVVRNPHLFVFSDDMDWARQNLGMDYPTTYVDHNGLDKDYEDLHLMSLCKHHIIANSTFSWWGAWLCSYTSKIVVGPKTWFAHSGANTEDLVLPSWAQL